ncbi:PfkB domain protein [Catenulispora acidiphila DSM 44928]|uniref:PfkB domain protein n=1 Tax=Catenulispora acidiphila (strain DSM 44928 / JCM 14897 / NBRC 102108 / NRRL B-24433 / ID139908) TaxID=479433 RepID=C7PWA3_CATAD|nr:5-dehydro-2-deoxygluconokinase [Catenulispora acidiphila]ACU73351.1 PfkB domain protein [Catenulispora acidiphila DSM 44928]
MSYDVITMGRIGVDVYPLQVGVGLEDVETFGKFLGGSATNVAVASARHGRRTAVVTRVGADPFGRFVRRALRGFGVDDAFLAEVEGLPTPVTFCEMFPPDDFPIYFYRWPKAPDLMIAPDELDLDAIARAGVFWATLTGLSAEPSRSAHHAAWQARAAKPHTILDLDYRPQFWDTRAAAGRAARLALPHVTAAVGNLDECLTAVGERDPHRAADALLSMGPKLAVVKLGAEGVLARTADTTLEIPAPTVKVLNGLGAGDAFGGALCHALLEAWPLKRALHFANTAGALVAARIECSTAMPDTAEVLAALEAGDA